MGAWAKILFLRTVLVAGSHKALEGASSSAPWLHEAVMRARRSPRKTVFTNIPVRRGPPHIPLYKTTSNTSTYFVGHKGAPVHKGKSSERDRDIQGFEDVLDIPIDAHKERARA